MSVSTRKAMLDDVPRLWTIRREAILKLALTGMSVGESQTWAAKMTIAGMEKRFREAEIWIADSEGITVGWIAIRVDYIDGLYVDPLFARQGIGSQLLQLSETLMREQGIQTVRLDSSINAEEFYLRRGYQRAGVPAERDAIPLRKRL
jgi:putative acetyltransferase